VDGRDRLARIGRRERLGNFAQRLDAQAGVVLAVLVDGVGFRCAGGLRCAHRQPAELHADAVLIGSLPTLRRTGVYPSRAACNWCPGIERLRKQHTAYDVYRCINAGVPSSFDANCFKAAPGYSRDGNKHSYSSATSPQQMRRHSQLGRWPAKTMQRTKSVAALLADHLLV
jgi:hypothetical protein